MHRSKFIKSLGLLSLTGTSMKTNALSSLSDVLSSTDKMPVLFLGHGSPMNAIEENDFVAGFRKAGSEIRKPNAILCISAHWETKGTHVTSMEQPNTIHDFGGFPQQLYDVEYPAPGSPELAKETKQLITETEVELNENWGLDHGAWSVIKHLYPQADVPTIQLSLDYTKPAKYHFELAQQLSVLRKKGVLIIGSGNMIHNLRLFDWRKLAGKSFAFDWAIEAGEKMQNFILNRDFKSLIDYQLQGKAFELAIPTPEHYLPLLYALALTENNDNISIFNNQPIGGSLNMTSLKIEP